MTKFQALYIAYLRAKMEGSWRWVSASYKRRYVDKLPFSLNTVCVEEQTYGKELCKEASKLLNINVD